MNPPILSGTSHFYALIGHPNDPLPIDPYTFRSGIIVADSVTKPNITPFLKSARSNTCFIQKGSEMADAQLQIFLDFLGTPPENSHT